MSWISKRNIYFALFYFTLAVLTLELGIRYIVLGEPRIFNYSSTLGWVNSNYLNVTQNDSYGSWQVTTNENGVRIAENQSLPNEYKFIILGDSFAFGEGVAIHKRFDYINANLADNSLNLGVMGYSPLQSFLRLNELGISSEKTKILLLVYENDLRDSVEYATAYRYRPILTVDGVEFPNTILDKLHGFFRDKSYLYYAFYRYVLKPEVKVEKSIDLFDNLDYINRQVNGSLHVIFHGFEANYTDTLMQSPFCLEVLCSNFLLSRHSDPGLYLGNDIHWNANRHERFSVFIDTILKNSNE